MLPQILEKLPQKFNRYFEPFFGGGALYFSLKPRDAIISDCNSELVNLYSSVAQNVEAVIRELDKYSNDEDQFYMTRKLDWLSLSPVQAAARTLFLNKTCFNGLYRVNKSGQFNVPFGFYKNPNLAPADALRSASMLLSKSKILHCDYKTVLNNEAREGDLVFLDPPYLPISRNSDFKRYTKEQFYEEDHRELAVEAYRLHNIGCHVVLTNSNHPLVYDLYKKFKIEVIQTKRHISCDGEGRTGEDLIVYMPPKRNFNIRLVPPALPEQVYKFPTTRYMGSKSKLLAQVWGAASQIEFDSVLDLFSGSGVVSYMLKAQGKEVITNDYMAMAATTAKALVENSEVKLSKADIEKLVSFSRPHDQFVQDLFKGLYFEDSDNLFIDVVRANIKRLRDPYKRAIATAALIRSCVKKRPRGIFTYVGNRYDDGRGDLKKSLSEHFLSAVEILNDAVFNNGRINVAKHSDALEGKFKHPDLVYIDPPYYSPHSDNEYVRRYHFVEGLARDWQDVEIQHHTLTKKFRSYPTPFSSEVGAYEAFDKLFKRFAESAIIVSYSSNSLPTMHEMTALLAKYKRHVDVVPIDHKYSFGNQKHKIGNNRNAVKEYLFVGQ